MEQEVTIRDGLAETAARAEILSEAYQRRRSSLWWPNLVTLVLPAGLSTLAAILAAFEGGPTVPFGGASVPLASVLAGAAAVLVAFHKVLKCDEYQQECLRLSQSYRAIAFEADSARALPQQELHDHHGRLADQLARLTADAQAQVPRRFVHRAEKARQAPLG